MCVVCTECSLNLPQVYTLVYGLNNSESYRVILQRQWNFIMKFVEDFWVTTMLKDTDSRVYYGVYWHTFHTSTFVAYTDLWLQYMARIYNPSTLYATACWFTYTSVTSRYELLDILMVPVFTIWVKLFRTSELFSEEHRCLVSIHSGMVKSLLLKYTYSISSPNFAVCWRKCE